MKTLSKIHKDYIIKMIDSNCSINEIKNYCNGVDINTDNYSSPIHISINGKLTIRYRNINTYYYI